MDFSFNDEQKMIRDVARSFADEVVAPRAAEMDDTGEYPYDILSQMADLGMMGLPFPEKYGGSNGNWVGMEFVLGTNRSCRCPPSLLLGNNYLCCGCGVIHIRHPKAKEKMAYSYRSWRKNRCLRPH